MVRVIAWSLLIQRSLLQVLHVYGTCIIVMEMCVIGLDVTSKMYYHKNRTHSSLFDIYSLL